LIVLAVESNELVHFLFTIVVTSVMVIWVCAGCAWSDVGKYCSVWGDDCDGCATVEVSGANALVYAGLERHRSDLIHGDFESHAGSHDVSTELCLAQLNGTEMWYSKLLGFERGPGLLDRLRSPKRGGISKLRQRNNTMFG